MNIEPDWGGNMMGDAGALGSTPRVQGERGISESGVLEEDFFSDTTVLIVDDEPNIVTLLETWLETIGCRVVSAGDGRQGVDKAKEVCPDLILMDGMMPRLSGFDACRELKGDILTRDIPVIFLTVQGEVQDVVKGLELGAHGYMTKPFKPQELLARVRSTLKIKKIQDRLRLHTQSLRTRWDWISGALEQLPVGLLVFDTESGELLFCNDRWRELLGARQPDASSFQFLKEGKSCGPLGTMDDLDGVYEVLVSGKSLGELQLRVGSFQKNGRHGRLLALL